MNFLELAGIWVFQYFKDKKCVKIIVYHIAAYIHIIIPKIPPPQKMIGLAVTVRIHFLEFTQSFDWLDGWPCGSALSDLGSQFIWILSSN